MEIVSKSIDLVDYGKIGKASVCKIHVKITDTDSRISAIIKTVADKTWISKLNPINNASFEAAAIPTINKILKILRAHKIGDEITQAIGEYVISDSASDSLCTEHGHTKLPMSELWKEKLSGNPGFDFHTICTNNYVIFGEAKYRSGSNPHTQALEQAGRFISAGKHDIDARNIRDLGYPNPAQNIIGDLFGCAAAFSVKGKNIDRILDNALRSQHINALLDYEKVYVIGVEIC